jgi:hypothetical protein
MAPGASRLFIHEHHYTRSFQQDVAFAIYPFESSEARKIRLSEGVERHQIALAIQSGASAVLDPRIAQRSRIYRNPNPVETAIVEHG